MNAQEAIDAWTELERRIQVGAYEERSFEHHETGTWPDDGVEESIANLETWTQGQGLEFVWSWDTHTWSLEPIEATLVDCPYCHGAHYTGQVCPLMPRILEDETPEDWMIRTPKAL